MHLFGTGGAAGHGRHQLEDGDLRVARYSLINQLTEAGFQPHQDKKYAFVCPQTNLPLTILPIFSGMEEVEVNDEQEEAKGVKPRRQLYQEEIANCEHGFLIGLYNFGWAGDCYHYAAYLIYRHPQLRDQIFTIDPLGHGKKGAGHPAGQHFLAIMPGEFSLIDANIIQQRNNIDCGFMSYRNIFNLAFDILNHRQQIVVFLQPEVEQEPDVDNNDDAEITLGRIAIKKSGFDVKNNDMSANAKYKKVVIAELKKIKKYIHYDFEYEIQGNEKAAEDDEQKKKELILWEEYDYDAQIDAQANEDYWESLLRNVIASLYKNENLKQFVQVTFDQTCRSPHLPRDAKGHVASPGAEDCMQALAAESKDFATFYEARKTNQKKYNFFISRVSRVAYEMTKVYLFENIGAALRLAQLPMEAYDAAADKNAYVDAQLDSLLDEKKITAKDGTKISLRQCLKLNSVEGTYEREMKKRHIGMLKQQFLAAKQSVTDYAERIEQQHHLLRDINMAITGLTTILKQHRQYLRFDKKPTVNKGYWAPQPQFPSYTLWAEDLEEYINRLQKRRPQVQYGQLTLMQILVARQDIFAWLNGLVKAYLTDDNILTSQKAIEQHNQALIAQYELDKAQADQDYQEALAEYKQAQKDSEQPTQGFDPGDPWAKVLATSAMPATQNSFKADRPRKQVVANPVLYSAKQFTAVQHCVLLLVDMVNHNNRFIAERHIKNEYERIYWANNILTHDNQRSHADRFSSILPLVGTTSFHSFRTGWLPLLQQMTKELDEQMKGRRLTAFEQEQLSEEVAEPENVFLTDKDSAEASDEASIDAKSNACDVGNPYVSPPQRGHGLAGAKPFDIMRLVRQTQWQPPPTQTPAEAAKAGDAAETAGLAKAVPKVELHTPSQVFARIQK